MKLIYTLPLLASFTVMSGCSDPTDYDFEESVADARAAADPPPLPFPTSLFFAGSTDGTLNIPLGANDDPADFGNPRVALNTLDGFSTTQPLTSSFSSPLDAATLLRGETVRVFEVITDSNPDSPTAGAVIGLVGEVPPQTYVPVVAGETTLAVQPLVPFAESTDYMVVVTNGVTDTSGMPAVNSIFRLTSGQLSLANSDFAQLEGVRLANGAMLQVAEAAGVERASIVQIWNVKTQSITPVLQSVAAATQPGVIGVQPVGLTTSDVGGRGVADVYVGQLQVPYYLTAPANANDPVGVSSFWRGAPAGDSQEGSFLTRVNSMPVRTSDQTIPVMMTVPNINSGQEIPDAGWPVAIFVHGITRDRTDMLAIADALAGVGYAVIAIDQPMHGITDTQNGFRTEFERTFEIDLANNTTGAPGPDGITDSSGTHFYSPAQLLTTRDNLRQSVADLLVLSASIANIGAVPLDSSRKALIGFSLGGTAATTFAAFDDSLTSVSLAMPAAGLVPMTLASPAFREPILDGLEAAEIVPGTSEFSQFVISAQTIVDSGDPINFGARAASMYRIHMMEVVGDEAAGIPSDQTVPNTVDGAPLAGSTALARVMGLNQVSSDTGEPGIVRFIAGDHGSLLNPAASPAATVEMQTQVAVFARSGGTLIDITDPSVILSSESP